MRHLAMLLLLSGIAGASVRTPPAVPPPAVVPPPRIQQLALSSGAPVWLLERHEVPLVRVEASVCWPGATADTDAQLAQAFANQLLGSGTAQRSGEQLSSALDALGAEWDVGLGGSRAWADVEVPTGNEAAGVALVAEALLQPRITRREGRQTRTRWARWRDALELDLHRIHARGVNQIWFPAPHPSRHTSQTEDVEALRTKDAMALVDEVLRTGRAFFVVVGDTTAEAILPILEAHYGGLQGDREPATVAHGRTDAATWLVDRSGFDVAEISVLTPGPSLDDPDRPAARVLVELLAGSFTSRMSLDLRESRGLTYGVNGRLESWNGTGRIKIDVEVENGRVGEAIGAMQGHLDAVMESIGPEELEMARNGLIADSGTRFATTSYAASHLGSLLLYTRPITWAHERDRALATTGLDQVQAAAERWLQPHHRAWVVTGDRLLLEAQMEAADRFPTRIVEAEALGRAE